MRFCVMEDWTFRNHGHQPFSLCLFAFLGPFWNWMVLSIPSVEVLRSSKTIFLPRTRAHVASQNEIGFGRFWVKWLRKRANQPQDSSGKRKNLWLMVSGKRKNKPKPMAYGSLLFLSQKQTNQTSPMLQVDPSLRDALLLGTRVM